MASDELGRVIDMSPHLETWWKWCSSVLTTKAQQQHELGGIGIAVEKAPTEPQPPTHPSPQGLLHPSSLQDLRASIRTDWIAPTAQDEDSLKPCERQYIHV